MYRVTFLIETVIAIAAFEFQFVPLLGVLALMLTVIGVAWLCNAAERLGREQVARDLSAEESDYLAMFDEDGIPF